MCHKTRSFLTTGTKILKFHYLLRFESGKEKKGKKEEEKGGKEKKKRKRGRKRRKKKEKEGERIRILIGAQNPGLVAKQVEQSRGEAEAEAEPA